MRGEGSACASSPMNVESPAFLGGVSRRRDAPLEVHVATQCDRPGGAVVGDLGLMVEPGEQGEESIRTIRCFISANQENTN